MKRKLHPSVRVFKDGSRFVVELAECAFVFSHEGLSELRDKIHEHMGADDFQSPPASVAPEFSDNFRPVCAGCGTRQRPGITCCAWSESL